MRRTLAALAALIVIPVAALTAPVGAQSDQVVIHAVDAALDGMVYDDGAVLELDGSWSDGRKVRPFDVDAPAAEFNFTLTEDSVVTVSIDGLRTPTDGRKGWHADSVYMELDGRRITQPVRDGVTVTKLKKRRLAAGDHVLRVTSREDGAAIKAVYLDGARTGTPIVTTTTTEQVTTTTTQPTTTTTTTTRPNTTTTTAPATTTTTTPPDTGSQIQSCSNPDVISIDQGNWPEAFEDQLGCKEFVFEPGVYAYSPNGTDFGNATIRCRVALQCTIESLEVVRYDTLIIDGMRFGMVDGDSRVNYPLAVYYGGNVRISDSVVDATQATNQTHGISIKNVADRVEILDSTFRCVRHCIEISQNGNIQSRPAITKDIFISGNSFASPLSAITNRGGCEVEVDNNTFDAGTAYSHSPYWALYPFGASNDNGELFIPDCTVESRLTNNAFGGGNVSLMGRGVAAETVYLKGNTGGDCSLSTMRSDAVAATADEETTAPPALAPGSDACGSETATTLPTTTTTTTQPTTTTTEATTTTTSAPPAGDAQIRADWLSTFNDPGDNYSYSPQDSTRPGQVGRGDGLDGTYTYSRAFSRWVHQVGMAMELGVDPADVMPELVRYAERLDSNIKDHDGRGYEYTRYMRFQSNTERFVYTDLHFLEESLFAATLADLAHILHTQRAYHPDADDLAARFFDHLDQVWLPKWMARTGTETPRDSAYANWSHPDTPDADASNNEQNWARGSHFDDRFEFPVRSLLHPFSGSIWQYRVTGDYYAETGRPSNYSPAQYRAEAADRADWIESKAVARNGGLIMPHNPDKAIDAENNSPNIDTYWSETTPYWVRLNRVGLLSDSLLEGVAKTIADLYPNSVTGTHARYMDGTGPDVQILLRGVSWFAAYDDSGKIAGLVQESIDLGDGPTSHYIRGRTNKHDGNLLVSQLLD